MLPCPFHSLTGLSCPGCGLQRAVVAALQGDFSQAFRFNAFLPVMLAIVALYLAAMALRGRFPCLYRALSKPRTALVVVALIMAWWVVRNVAGI